MTFGMTKRARNNETKRQSLSEIRNDQSEFNIESFYDVEIYCSPMSMRKRTTEKKMNKKEKKKHCSVACFRM